MTIPELYNKILTGEVKDLNDFDLDSIITYTPAQIEMIQRNIGASCKKAERLIRGLEAV